MGITIKKPQGGVEPINKVVLVTGTVETTHKDGSIETKEEILAEINTKEATALVNVSMGLTKNLGNYESLKIQIGITIPCLPTGEDIEATYEQAKAWVDEKVSEVNAEVEVSTGG